MVIDAAVLAATVSRHHAQLAAIALLTTAHLLAVRTLHLWPTEAALLWAIRTLHLLLVWIKPATHHAPTEATTKATTEATTEAPLLRAVRTLHLRLELVKTATHHASAKALSVATCVTQISHYPRPMTGSTLTTFLVTLMKLPKTNRF
jgi:hypothetical protein